MTKKSIWLAFAGVTFVLLILDLWLKIWAFENLRGQDSIVLISGVLGLRYLQNPGAFFGFLGGVENSRYFLAVVKLLVLVGIGWYYWKLPTGKKFWFFRVPLILIFAGGLGNLVDRVTNDSVAGEIVRRGEVRDMLEFLFMNFAVFNLADVYVTVGVFSLIFVMLFVVKDFPFPGEKSEK